MCCLADNGSNRTFCTSEHDMRGFSLQNTTSPHRARGHCSVRRVRRSRAGGMGGRPPKKMSIHTNPAQTIPQQSRAPREPNPRPSLTLLSPTSAAKPPGGNGGYSVASLPTTLSLASAKHASILCSRPASGSPPKKMSIRTNPAQAFPEQSRAPREPDHRPVNNDRCLTCTGRRC